MALEIKEQTLDTSSIQDKAMLAEAMAIARYSTANMLREEIRIEKKSVLFQPLSKDLKLEYPELSDFREFQVLKKNSELLFVWWYANKSSPLAKLRENDPVQKRMRIFYALQNSGLHLELEKSEVEDFLSGILPSKLATGIERMRTFSPSARSRAKEMVAKMFNKLESISDTPLPKDADAQSKVVNTIQKTTEVLPDLLKLLESGFSVTEKKGAEDRKQAKTIDRVIHESE